MGFSQRKANAQICELEDSAMWHIQGLSVRTCNILNNTNLYSESELFDFAKGVTEKEFDAAVLQIEMCGRKSLNEIKDYLLSKEPTLWGYGWQSQMEAALKELDGGYSAMDVKRVIRLLSDEVMRLRRHVDGA